ncbi:MAG: hypothetical protein IKD08_04135 [Alphaproteobacteria bacterium]|nr:hypothetical protein [Alphaproteobacteria bacterium]
MLKLTKDDLTFSPWDAADYLTSEKMIAYYLEEVFSDATPKDIVRALKNCARAKSRLKNSKKAKIAADIEKEMVTKTEFSADALLKTIHALGFRIKLKKLPSAKKNKKR